MLSRSRSIGWILTATALAALLVPVRLPAQDAGAGVAAPAAPAAPDFAPGEGLEAAVTGDYLLGPGDALQIDIWGPQPVTFRPGITPEGRLLIPAVGEVNLKNLSLTEAKRIIRRKVLGHYRNVDVGVTLVRLRRFQIHVLGQVTIPGTYLASAVDRVSVAVARAGGLTPQASQRQILVENGDSIRVEADLFSFLGRGQLDTNPFLQDGDVVYVPFSKNRFQVLGSVSAPGEIQFLSGDRLSDAIFLSGGFLPNAFVDTLEVARFLPDQEDPLRFLVVGGKGIQATRQQDSKYIPQAIRWFTPEGSGIDPALVPELPDFELSPNDIIIVRQDPLHRERKLVSVTGEVQYPGIYPIRNKETRLSQVIEWTGGLTEDAFLIEAQLIRRKAIRLEDKEFQRLLKVPVSDMSDEEYEYFKMKSRETPGAMVVNFRRALANPESKDNLLLQAGDVIDIPPRKEFVSVLGVVGYPGNVTYEPGLKAADYIKRAGGYSEDADKRKARVIKADGKEWVPFREAGPLIPGDTVFVPERPDRDFWRIFRDTLTVTTQILTIYLVADRALQ